MNREMMQERLTTAERYVAQDEELVAKQARLVEEFIIDGLDAVQAKKLLRLFKETLDLRYSDRDQLRSMLAGSTQAN